MKRPHSDGPQVGNGDATVAPTAEASAPRGDVETVSAHLTDIRAHAPQTLASYVALARATLARVLTDGRLLPIRATRITASLDSSPRASRWSTRASHN